MEPLTARGRENLQLYVRALIRLSARPAIPRFRSWGWQNA